MTTARIVFAGTPEFAASHLAALLHAGIQPVAVYSQPDRPAGRGQQLQMSAVKQLALAHGIAVEQPLSLKADDAQQRLRAYQPDLLIVVAYGLLLPQAVLDIPTLGCVNVHGSILPRWRGAAPIQRALLAGDNETGVDLMRMGAGLDTGPVLASARTPIRADDTGGSLHDRLAQLGAELLVTHLPHLLRGECSGQQQNDALATYAKKLDKAEALIDWSQSAAQIDRQIRAFNPWPVAQTQLGSDTLRIWFSQLSDRKKSAAAAGTIIEHQSDALLVTCGDGVLAITELQWPGGKRLPVRDVLNARAKQLAVGNQFASPTSAQSAHEKPAHEQRSL
ncbi:methionyl-tRNA formyltransferase [Permianibacter sp. IMCC34836]|uniref:methionyl-tRNA formyltransferase n=1 Tax=Permianibacter fluminis TaxID=2738515 RepID=UPI0015563172|nr:methionyl-tRNA formyltransferase [Permianibacter fluminis]NQD36067.1 methionyl-tRNA formyltransferase [Permianibacter fluminis]